MPEWAYSVVLILEIVPAKRNVATPPLEIFGGNRLFGSSSCFAIFHAS